MLTLEQKDLKRWGRMGPRAMLGQFMLNLAESDLDLIVLSADLGRSSGLDRFKKKYPEKYLSVGISEQNLIGVAAGLAKEGHKVFVTSFAPFLSMRASEQIRMNLGYMEIGVNVIALGSGLSMGYLGNSHFGLEDVAIMRAIPNINVTAPADCLELKKVLEDYAYNERGPSYIRLTGVPGSPQLYEEDFNYQFGKPQKLFDGEDVLIVATGSISAQAKIAVSELKLLGVSVGLLNVNSIKPLHDDVIKLVGGVEKVVVIEEHTLVGGLFSAICERIVPLGYKPKLLPITLPDSFGPTGTYEYLLDYHGLNSQKIVKKIVEFLGV